MKANNTDHEYNFTWNLFAHRKDILEFKLLVVKNYECVDIEYLMLDDEEFALFMLKFG